MIMGGGNISGWRANASSREVPAIQIGPKYRGRTAAWLILRLAIGAVAWFTFSLLGTNFPM